MTTSKDPRTSTSTPPMDLAEVAEHATEEPETEGHLARCNC